MFRYRALVVSMVLVPAVAVGQDAVLRVDPGAPGIAVSRLMTGACIEDVNHEIYGGLYSQMVFGESFQEPPITAVEGFRSFGGSWSVDEGVLRAGAGDGPKLIADGPPLGEGEVSVQVRFEGTADGLAGLILQVDAAAEGADRFDGYEVSLDPGRQILGVGRHRQNWEPIRDVPCEVPIGRWIDLTIRMSGDTFEVRVDGRPVFKYEDRDHPLPPGSVGLRTWRREALFRNLVIERDGTREPLAFLPADPAGLGGVSGMWRPVWRGRTRGTLSLETDRPFVGRQAQRITFVSGEGSIGVENRGLNRWGLNFEAGKPYEGFLWARADQPAMLRIAAEDGDGERSYAETSILIDHGEWFRYDFTLTPSASDPAGRLALTLDAPGSVVLGHAFLQPGEWGRFRGLPVRKDVAEGLIREGLTVMRLGGLMANAEGYRWKDMIGPRDRRPPYKGFWYPHSSNGWGIIDFLDLCEAAGFVPVVDLNLDEAPEDLADFVEYANGPADSDWGRRRVQDGHPEPYRLRYIELGNEEAIDDAYWRRFRPLAEAIWAADPEVVLIVGDFEYRRPIEDPYHFEGAPRITSLAAHKRILDLAREHGREVWFDVHIWNHSPGDAPGRIAALKTFDAALARLSPGTNYRLCVLEENATNHAVRRAIAHGETLNGLIRMGDRVPIACAANALQPDGQNDNGWDQGLLFLDPSRVWIQPPGYVTQMIHDAHQPRCVPVAVEQPGGALDATALLGDGELTIQVVHVGDERIRARIEVADDDWASAQVRAAQLTGELDAVNTATDPERIVPWSRTLDADGAPFDFTFEPHSFTTLRLRKAPR